jgi:hypothetical protein
MRQQYCIVNGSIKKICQQSLIKQKKQPGNLLEKKRVSNQDGTTEVVPTSNKDDKKHRLNEAKFTVRTLALQETTAVDGAYLKSGRQINIDDARRQVEHAETLIQKT